MHSASPSGVPSGLQLSAPGGAMGLIPRKRKLSTATASEKTLAKLLEELKANDTLDGIGYSVADLNALLDSIQIDSMPDGDPDEVPEPPDEAVTRPGDLWLLGAHRLLCGDSSSVADVNRLLDGASIHLVNTDPPYNGKVEPRSNNAIAAGQRFTVDANAYTWSNTTRGGGPQEVTVTAPGVHLLSLWVRESGQIIDKLILTTNTAFTPTGAGPAASRKVPVGSNPTFSRGDANNDASIDIADALAILFFLFQGSSALDCEDHGDVDDNGTLQVTDVAILLNYLFKGGTAPAAPFPAAGRDTTADAYACGN